MYDYEPSYEIWKEAIELVVEQQGLTDLDALHIMEDAWRNMEEQSHE